jgi:2-polyprenyl-6-hydroxyphenyl methylase/3-demethylubiquinone-9 3-methyltransferase
VSLGQGLLSANRFALTARHLPDNCGMLSLTPVSAALVPCKICGEPAPLYGTVDFNRNCEIEGGIKLPPSGTPVRCRGCGFLFTDAFDRWSHDDFRTTSTTTAMRRSIRSMRRRGRATTRRRAGCSARAKDGRVLDYGGGNDAFCSHLRAAGFPLAVTYDPFVPDFASPPAGKYDLITCFETIGSATSWRIWTSPGWSCFRRCCSPRTSTSSG